MWNPTEATGKGLMRHSLIRCGFRTGEIMVCLVINGRKIPGEEALVDSLKIIPGMTSISLNVNKEKTNVILGREVINLWGRPYIEDYIGEVKYQISPLSFFQVNPVQTERLYGKALEYAGLTGRGDGLGPLLRYRHDLPPSWPGKPEKSTAWRSSPTPSKTPVEMPP